MWLSGWVRTYSNDLRTPNPVRAHGAHKLWRLTAEPVTLKLLLGCSQLLCGCRAGQQVLTNRRSHFLGLEMPGYKTKGTAYIMSMVSLCDHISLNFAKQRAGFPNQPQKDNCLLAWKSVYDCSPKSSTEVTSVKMTLFVQEGHTQNKT